ncbi:hypothetical protein [Actimicrobium sp. CCI2.3]|uniref:hypothetical protein n=1 Tax=Actimicrobium sp. CCI2.3 TaxID=3048616 RepID=UPI002AB575F5|nr:hypothetical protein [Actimicrobium sp. CCI2.3]MDY7573591.1 hypothetical protein [Actimicrobium sp. CCI2.3]MEB0022105.1 hypothetical protein [Actimicrobium sp. CCI2.3]
MGQHQEKATWDLQHWLMSAQENQAVENKKICARFHQERRQPNLMDSQRRPEIVLLVPLHLALPVAAACLFKVVSARSTTF